uniref:CP-type G domain-containing protein n=1 Tax=Neobodo designis TaxID=312471 RepID=A0A7S1MS38_NEODS|mmetsp:Transcript_46167/g.142322  ORF Transcript_46167/g.142322 Transcript_46167/m.142322 type:complete len:818 (+) Transcript_46167:79-2532(+)|eukprot:CAMPEP_0174855370 /NCGR_PEP_ID=MMETSP1114-20130205/33120_1 /TAXON_ID=312471 /ORGANISM="Neobodo designis, Strain CCAP 1951/1" /LENGTH=817 /DNA_ID=CAMNT_0016090109 /DNA_START=80 /DNA_END=2533 /DNA_ORIENTATION=+
MPPAANMGKSLVRAKKKRQLQNRANFQAILEQEHRQHIAQETAPKLQSVWQTTNLDDVIEAAGEREEGFTANRDVRVVVSGTTHVVADGKVVPQSTDDRDWHTLSNKLPIPERPPWNFRMKADELQNQERQAFVNWRRELARLEEADKVVMTPYEKNLEVWRQLWRVVEKSDVVLQIVDARNPLTFRSAGFERYVAKHNTKTGQPKPVILLLNKADLLTEEQRKAWAGYLQSQGLRFYFFSARQSTEAALAAAGHVDPNAAPEEDDDASGSDDADASDDDDEPQLQSASDLRKGRGAGGLEDELIQAETARKAAAARAAAAAQTKKQRRRTDRRSTGAPTKVDNPYALKSLRDDAEERRLKREEERAKEKPLTAEEVERDRRLAQHITDKFKPWDVLDPITLLDALAVMREALGVTSTLPITVGLTGYPNVGKSSTINAIMQSKKVVVSATPGKTKHFQTLQIPNERRLLLCDCPGLVFPSFASTKEAMVCDGILPVDTCRDYLAAVAHVCNRVPQAVLERTYFICLDRELDVDLSASHAEMFLNFVSRRKGFMTEHDKPNRYRSAHIVLKDFVDGKVVFVHPPPGLVLADPMVDGPARPKRQDDGARGAVPKGVRSVASKGPQAAAAPAAAADDEWETDDEDGGEWETASDDDGADEAWEDISDAEDGRNLSDDGADSYVSDEEEIVFTFYGTTKPGVKRALTTAEVFNLEHNYAIAEAPLEGQRQKKKKVNPMLMPDETVRINRHGEKELLLDDDDEIVICGMDDTSKEKKVSKRVARRQAKRGVVAARGAKPAALPGAYEARTDMGEATRPPAF